MSQGNVETASVPLRKRADSSTSGALPAGDGVVRVPITAVLPGESPRAQGIDQEHIVRLAGVDGTLPPILVRRADMRVIDGMHRLFAALVKGDEAIDIEFFDGPPADAFLRAVEANVAHGLPLSLADRKAAAARIVASHPQMSNRAVAAISGLGAKAVATIRQRSSESGRRLSARVGQDGRLRPLNSADGRLRAAEVIAERPEASVREIARLAGIAPATASDVRRRLEAGNAPVPTRRTPVPSLPGQGPSVPAVDLPFSPGGVPPTGLVLEKLLRDPSLRMKEEGRHLLRLLHENEAAEWLDLGAAVPPHCVQLVGNLARRYAASWLEFAQQVEDREQLAAQSSRCC